MGWLIRYTAKRAAVLFVPGKGEIKVQPGDVLDVPPTSEVRMLVSDPEAPWERIAPNHPNYVKPEDRA